MEVKYSVIKLCMQEKISKYLVQMDPGFHREHEKAKAKPWKLSHNGYYYKNLHEERIIIVTET